MGIDIGLYVDDFQHPTPLISMLEKKVGLNILIPILEESQYPRQVPPDIGLN